MVSFSNEHRDARTVNINEDTAVKPYIFPLSK
jgi:hypothetical protein